MGFSENLCDLMQKKSVSSYKLATGIGVHVSTVTNWKEGKGVKVEHLKLVADYFGVSIDDLLKEGEANERTENL